MKGSCVLFLLNLNNKDVHLILAQILSGKKISEPIKIKRSKQIGVVYFSSMTRYPVEWF
jgi:hypothetical protein